MDTRRELFKIDSGSRLPLYDQIARHLRDLIINGRLQPGQMMPSEWDLSELYGVSRLTVRKALDELVRQNWLERRQGMPPEADLQRERMFTGACGQGA